MDSLFPSREDRVRAKQEVQKGYKDRDSQNRYLFVGDRFFVSSVEGLRGFDKCSRWVPGHVVCRNGVKLTVELFDERVVVRHADQVRKRHCADVSVPKAPAEGEVTGVAQPGAANREASVTEAAARLPDRSPDSEPPTADLSGGSASASAGGAGSAIGSNHSVSPDPGPSPAAGPPRYALRDRSTIKRPDRLKYE